jgi:hypothetical protein
MNRELIEPFRDAILSMAEEAVKRYLLDPSRCETISDEEIAQSHRNFFFVSDQTPSTWVHEEVIVSASFEEVLEDPNDPSGRYCDTSFVEVGTVMWAILSDEYSKESGQIPFTKVKENKWMRVLE